jgi:cobalamin biosynthesis Mg chelatase CobN
MKNPPMAAIGETIGEAWSSGSELARELGSSAVERASDLAASAAQRVPDVSPQVSRMKRRARRRLSPRRDGLPWSLLVVVAAAIGLALVVAWWRRRGPTAGEEPAATMRTGYAERVAGAAGQ